MGIDFRQARWLNPPVKYEINQDRVSITTEPDTDFWQTTYYGFQNENAPALLLNMEQDFTFSCKCTFAYTTLFDQCGLIVFLDQQNWFKASIEYDNPEFSRLGSVVTNLGYSDWATTDIPLPQQIWFRLSRRGADFLIEYANDGEHFQQMRIFHLHLVADSHPGHNDSAQTGMGLYACSPGNSSFQAEFSDFNMSDCKWLAHVGSS